MAERSNYFRLSVDLRMGLEPCTLVPGKLLIVLVIRGGQQQFCYDLDILYALVSVDPY